MILGPGHILHNMLSWVTLTCILLLFTAIRLEGNSNQKQCGDLKLAVPFYFGTTGKGSEPSLGNHWLDILCSSTGLEAEEQASSSTNVRVNNSIYGYSNCSSCYTGAGAKMLHSDKVHAAMNLTYDTQMITTSNSNTNANNFTVIGYESFGFIGYEPLILNVNNPLADQEDGACSSGTVCGHSSIPRGIDYSSAKKAAEYSKHNFIIHVFLVYQKT